MICRACGHVIADQAIVCYKCGTPTASAAPGTPASQSAPPRRQKVPGWLIAVDVAAVAVFVAVTRFTSSRVGWIAAAAAAAAFVAGVAAVARSRFR